MTSAPPIGFEYHGSKWLMLALVGIVLLALLSVLRAELPAWLQGVLIAFIAATAGVSLTRLLRPRVRDLLWRSDGGISLGLRDSILGAARETEASLHAVHVLGPLITLQLRWLDHGQASVWLLPDNLDSDTRRRLRIRIRHGAQGDSA